MFERKEAETLYGVMGVVFAPKPKTFLLYHHTP
ncbi:MAG: hypothetical protein ACLR23_01860 [Clostridia bacterium]